MVEDSVITRQKILKFIEREGPSLPIPIAKEISMNPLFVSAYLSQLVSEGNLKISKMKVGNSPLYFLNGQETRLEKFTQYLQPKEREAQQLLKQSKIISDIEQDPAIRVALRNIKDFAIPFEKENQIYWKYIGFNLNLLQKDSNKNSDEGLKKDTKENTTKESVLKENEEKISAENNELNVKDSMLEIKKQAEKQIENETEKELKENPQQKQNYREEKKTNIQKNILSLENNIPKKEKIKEGIKNEPKRTEKKKEVQKSDFIQKISDYLNKKNIEVINEIEIKKKEYSAIIKINSDIGKILFYLYAKDKKKISTDDLIGAIKKAQEKNLSALFICPGQMNKKTEEYLNDNRNILKFKQLE